MVSEQTPKEFQVSIDFGTKKVRKHGDYTRVIALDKKALQACGCPDDKVIMAKVELIKNPNRDFLKVTPFCEEASQNEKKEDVGIVN